MKDLTPAMRRSRKPLRHTILIKLGSVLARE